MQEHTAIGVSVVVVQEGPIGKFSVLLHDSEGGGGWELPGGELLDFEHDRPEGNARMLLSCIHYIAEQTNLTDEHLDDGFEGIQQLAYLYLDEEDYLELTHWAEVDTDKMESLEKALKDKCGNAMFFEVDFNPSLPFQSIEKAIPNLKYEHQAEAIACVLSNLVKHEH